MTSDAPSSHKSDESEGVHPSSSAIDTGNDGFNSWTERGDLDSHNDRQRRQLPSSPAPRLHPPSRSDSSASQSKPQNDPRDQTTDASGRADGPLKENSIKDHSELGGSPIAAGASLKDGFTQGSRRDDKSTDDIFSILSPLPSLPQLSSSQIPRALGVDASSERVNADPDTGYVGRPGRVADFPPPAYSTNAVPRAEDFHRFYWKCMSLKSELIRLDFALRSVAASGPGIQAANDVKRRLRHLRDLYGINTTVLFPKDVNVQMYTPSSSSLYLKNFSSCFIDFAKALDVTEKALHDFNDVYHDETLTTQLFVLNQRFMDEGKKLTEDSIGADIFETKIRVQCFLIEWVEPAIESLIDPVRNFHEKGIPMIGFAQQNKTSRYFDMTTVATFLSGVTASMIQATVADVDTAAGVAANTFFFSSLVFSIGSAVNSLLVMSWRRSIVREPDGALKMWFKTWLNMGPMISLIISGAFFSFALCLSAFSTKQHPVTSFVTIGFTGVHAAMLFVLAVIHLKEKWRFRKKAGYIGQELTEDSIVLTLFDWAARTLRPWRKVSWLHRSNPESVFLSQAEKGDVSLMNQDIRNKRDSLLDLLLGSKEDFSEPRRDWSALADEKFFLPIAYMHGDYSQDPPVVDIVASNEGSMRHRVHRSSRSLSTASAGSYGYVRPSQAGVGLGDYGDPYRSRRRSPILRYPDYSSRSPSSESRRRRPRRPPTDVVDGGMDNRDFAYERGRSPDRRQKGRFSRSPSPENQDPALDVIDAPEVVTEEIVEVDGGEENEPREEFLDFESPDVMDVPASVPPKTGRSRSPMTRVSNRRARSRSPSPRRRQRSPVASNNEEHTVYIRRVRLDTPEPAANGGPAARRHRSASPDEKTRTPPSSEDEKDDGAPDPASGTIPHSRALPRTTRRPARHTDYRARDYEYSRPHRHGNRAYTQTTRRERSPSPHIHYEKSRSSSRGATGRPARPRRRAESIPFSSDAPPFIPYSLPAMPQQRFDYPPPGFIPASSPFPLPHSIPTGFIPAEPYFPQSTGFIPAEQPFPQGIPTGFIPAEPPFPQGTSTGFVPSGYVPAEPPYPQGSTYSQAGAFRRARSGPSQYGYQRQFAPIISGVHAAAAFLPSAAVQSRGQERRIREQNSPAIVVQPMRSYPATRTPPPSSLEVHIGRPSSPFVSPRRSPTRDRPRGIETSPQLSPPSVPSSPSLPAAPSAHSSRPSLPTPPSVPLPTTIHLSTSSPKSSMLSVDTQSPVSS